MLQKNQMILYFWWDEENNMFYDECGQLVINIFEMVTPNDLLLFKKDHGYCLFPHRETKGILCEFVTDDDMKDILYYYESKKLS